MKFSIILATRNRPELFREALESVRAQRDVDVELIVVNDGSDEQYLGAYTQIEREIGDGAQFHALPRAINGHGQSYALNVGVTLANGDYVGFLDDDDSWTDEHHLARALSIIDAQNGAVDVYYSAQRAYRDNKPQAGEIWLDGLELRLADPKKAGNSEYYVVTVADLLKATGFAHVNNTLIKRDHFLSFGGFDETIRYECDRDFYLRTIDGADSIIFAPAIVSRHNIPDPAAGTAMSTAISQVDRHIYQLRVLDKAICFAANNLIRAHGRNHKAFTLQKLAAAVEQAGRVREALFYAREAALLRPSLSAVATLIRLVWVTLTSRSSVKS